MNDGQTAHPIPAAAPPVDAYNRIFSAAEELFSNQGDEAVLMSAIAEHANVFRHLKPKRGPDLVVMKCACHKSTRLLDDMVQAVGGANPAVAATPPYGANTFFFRTADLLRHVPEAGFANDAMRYNELFFSSLLQGILQRTKGILPNTGNDTIKQDERQC